MVETVDRTTKEAMRMMQSNPDAIGGIDKRQSYSINNRALIRDCLRSIELGKVTPKVRDLLRLLGTRTLIELHKENHKIKSTYLQVESG